MIFLKYIIVLKYVDNKEKLYRNVIKFVQKIMLINQFYENIKNIYTRIFKKKLEFSKWN